MSLTRKFFLFNSSLITLVALLGGVAVSNVAAAWRTTADAAANYGVLDRAQSAATQVVWLRSNLQGVNAQVYRDIKYLDPVRKEAQAVLQAVEATGRGSDADGSVQRELAQGTLNHLEAAAQLIESHPTVPAPGEVDGVGAELDQAERALNGLAALAPGAARRQVTAAAVNMHDRLLWMCFWLLAVLGGSSFIHLRQYRALVKPLVWLRDDMRHSAALAYALPVAARGEGEFKEVAAYFNGLARDLAELYKGLEEKVIARSRELVRSERLASVGFLAAGVAHEINNPLSVISGYAELAGKDLRVVLNGGGEGSEAAAETDAEALSNALQAQEIIREEAFRCKEITSRLLSLARGSGDGRVALSLAEAARQVSGLTRGLKNYRSRRVVAEFDDGEGLEVVANPTEIKQVLLNLMVNALEAVPVERGLVRIGGRRDGAWVELYVEDNGKGMSPELLAQIFEPFFTAKRGSNEPGTGLGLSITHAIVENHGGRIRAESAGAGQGSRFTVILPAAVKAANGAALARKG